MRRTVLPVPTLEVGVVSRAVRSVVHLVPRDVGKDIAEHLVEGPAVRRLSAGRRV